MSLMSLQRDDVLRTLRKKIEKGCDCAQVIDAKKLLYPYSDSTSIHGYLNEAVVYYTPKDAKKAKCIYLCKNDDISSVMNYVNACIKEANTALGTDEKLWVRYKVQQFSNITTAIISRSNAHSTKRWIGKALKEELRSFLSSISKSPSTTKSELDEFRQAISMIDDDKNYFERYCSGYAYRCTMYDSALDKHIQANVCNVLILSGEHNLPKISLSPQRKKRKSIYDDLCPFFVFGESSYYTDYTSK